MKRPGISTQERSDFAAAVEYDAGGAFRAWLIDEPQIDGRGATQSDAVAAARGHARLAMRPPPRTVQIIKPLTNPVDRTFEYPFAVRDLGKGIFQAFALDDQAATGEATSAEAAVAAARLILAQRLSQPAGVPHRVLWIEPAAAAFDAPDALAHRSPASRQGLIVDELVAGMIEREALRSVLRDGLYNDRAFHRAVDELTERDGKILWDYFTLTWRSFARKHAKWRAEHGEAYALGDDGRED